MHLPHFLEKVSEQQFLSEASRDPLRPSFLGEEALFLSPLLCPPVGQFNSDFRPIWQCAQDEQEYQTTVVYKVQSVQLLYMKASLMYV